MRIFSLLTLVFFLTNCSIKQNELILQKNLYDLLKKDIKLTDLSIRTIFRDCQTFKKRKEYHPYSKSL